MKALMTIDVEDWFQTENFKQRIPPDTWGTQKLRVNNNVKVILDILEKNDAKGTFFILGWIAERAPEVVKAIQANGHEIASHGYGHECVYRLTPEEFREDLRKSKDIIENISGVKVKGYRAPNFSITDWAIDVLSELGFEYDSSYFPVIHDRYGKLTRFKVEDKPLFKLKEDFFEVPLSCLHLFGKNIPWSGGGYFRLIPYPLFKQGLRSILDREQSFNFYIHPWEFDPGQPRINDMHKINRFRHYNNIEKTADRFTRMVHDFKFQSVSDFIESQKQLSAQPV
jgi:polysaccharide deacetylase family protein (PEP-CTERM system associated)